MEDNNSGKYVFKKEDIWLIPNVITYFRMLCIPVFVALCLVGGLQDKINLIYWALAVFAIAAASDMVDGKIARKYHMISDIGKVFDPLADKLMHISAMLCLTIIMYLPWYFIVIVAVKEILMICLAPILIKKQIVIQAVFAGKIASLFLSLGVIAAFFHKLLCSWWTFGVSAGVEMSIDWILTAIGCVLAIYAMITYFVIMLKSLKQFNIDFAAGKVDKYGRKILDANLDTTDKE